MRSTIPPGVGEKEPTLKEWLQASLYFLPHVLFRLLALSFVFAFLGYYSIIVLAIIALAGLCLALPEVFKLKWKGDAGEDDGINALLSLVLSLLAPISLGSIFCSNQPSNQNWQNTTFEVERSLGQVCKVSNCR